MLHIRILAAMTERMVDQHQCQHGLGNRSRANPHAGVMAARCHHLRLITCGIHRLSGDANAGGGL